MLNSVKNLPMYNIARLVAKVCNAYDAKCRTPPIIRLFFRPIWFARYPLRKVPAKINKLKPDARKKHYV